MGSEWLEVFDLNVDFYASLDLHIESEAGTIALIPFLYSARFTASLEKPNPFVCVCVRGFFFFFQVSSPCVESAAG